MSQAWSAIRARPRFYDRCSDRMRVLLDGLAAAPDRPRPFPEIEDAIGWPRRRIASVLGGVCRLRGFGGKLQGFRLLSETAEKSERVQYFAQEVKRIKCHKDP